MTVVTLQVLEGLERGRTLYNLTPPITIGREDDNDVRLNDERVSRFHVKIQEDSGRLILTDLQSTNGTQVNGHPVQMRVLQVGDQLLIGRCLVLFGSAEEITNRAIERRQQEDSNPSDPTLSVSGDSVYEESLKDENDLLSAAFHNLQEEDFPELFPLGRPESPINLSAIQRAQISDILAFIHDQIRSVILAGAENKSSRLKPDGTYNVTWEGWQQLLALEMHMASYLKRIAEPD
ncbi:hypothetical protein MNBD_PLANCTO02-2691 [hydrothermal vent metagenome]|uniref:FHA domain-containing protein n=1 Tax=hydrothermal vent metagenome TaxID=652676 RepID=A0A3B1DGL5_9ZZZZ